jgi:hypothetical protein
VSLEGPTGILTLRIDALTTVLKELTTLKLTEEPHEQHDTKTQHEHDGDYFMSLTKDRVGEWKRERKKKATWSAQIIFCH